eukprot:TRINITY_DN70499_c0_g1_i1.p1 TRINITY_DN70499_c0_g1~~TRINITY_DN70499_c0_g1_i1.p1  ORF type:complete len:481 (+),score=178.15 TRINITY_DN70499_c0_g1_i1:111-1445(+)
MAADDPFAVGRYVVQFEMQPGSTSTIGECFELPRRYTVDEAKKGLGAGAYGFVVEAQDSVTGKAVAIKKLKNIFDARQPLKMKSTVREIKLLRHFSTNTILEDGKRGGHPNILRVLDIFVGLGDITPETKGPELRAKIDSFEDVYVVCEKFDMSLKQLLQSGSALEESQRAYFTYQMLKGMKAIFTANTIHRDMKPENLLVNTDTCDLTICDFGSGRGFDAATDSHMTVASFTTTQWYRPPEAFLEDLTRSGPIAGDAGEFVAPQGKVDASQALDIWSCGAILGEMMLGKPLCAAAGNDVLGQLNSIFTTIAPLTEDMLKPLGLPQQIVQLLQPTMVAGRNADLKKILKGQKGLDGEEFCDEEIDLLAQMMKIQPQDRILVDAALNHEYFSQYDLNEDRAAQYSAEPFSWRFSDCEDRPRGAIWDEVCLFNPQIRDETAKRLEQ